MSDYEVMAYYFPNYHHDVRNEKVHGKGWNEWALLRAAKPRFEGHNQPKVPLWGEENEADPAVMAKKINAAKDYGVTAFLFDWYLYEDGTFLERALDEGFLQAENSGDLKFALMWANHDYNEIMPARRLSIAQPHLLYPGKISVQRFRQATEDVIERYFSKPNYLRVDGGCYFSIYDVGMFIENFGSVEVAAQELALFRQKVSAAGLGSLNLNFIVISHHILSGKTTENMTRVLEMLGADSVSSYVWIHATQMIDFPLTDYASYALEAAKNYGRTAAQFDIPYFPNVTMGWDASPRTVQSDVYENLGYPFISILQNNTPAEFEKALIRVKEYLDGRTQSKVFSINAWNEWTEGSYLEPDTVSGFGYLEAIRRVFGSGVKEK